jgi:hypothetical protein
MADNTASLVVALSAQLTKFEKDMRAAGIMADKAVGDIEDKFSRMNPKVSTSFFGNLFASLTDKALQGAVDGVKSLIDRFVELEKTSKYTEISMQWLYGLQQAGIKAGASISDINTAVKAVAFSLDEMKRGGDNALKTLLDANPQFMKGVSRDSMTAAQTLQIVADIIAHAKNDIQAIDIAKNLGIPENSVALLQKGGDAVRQLAEQAARAAPDLAVIAAESKAIKEIWAAFIQSLEHGAIDTFFSGLKTAIEYIIVALEKLSVAQSGTLLGSMSEQALVKWREIGKTIEDANKSAKEAKEVSPIRVRIAGGTAVDPFARKAGGGGGADPMDDFDRQAKSIEKHTNAMVAEAATLGESAHAQEEYRVQLLLTEAALQKNNEISQETQDAIAGIAARAAGAKQQLAEASFAMQRLNSASQQVGSALSTAFADAIVEGKSLNDVVGSLIKTLEKAAINATVMSLFSPGAGGTTSPFASLFKGFAGGTDFAPGGMAMVGEHGPELVNLPRGSQVIPNDVLRSGSGGGGAIVYSPAIDARGASVEAVARLAQIMEQDRATFASRTVATIQQARRGRVPGL